MSRGFSSSVIRAVKAADQASQANARQHAAQAKAQERLQKLERQQAKQDYYVSRQTEAEDENVTLAETVRGLKSILATGLARNPVVAFTSLYRLTDPADLPASLKNPTEPSKSAFSPQPLDFFASLIPGARKKHAAAVAAGDVEYIKAMNEFEQLKAQRIDALKMLEAAAAAHNQEIDAFKAGFEAGDPAAVKAYSELVLVQSRYPDGFPQEMRVGFVADSNQLVADLRVPLMHDIVPEMERFKYMKAQDTIVGTKNPEKARQILYFNAIAQTSLRTLHELFKADSKNHIQTIVLNVYVATIDPSTGNVVQPYILSIRVAREEFTELRLAAVEPIACLKRLKAVVSRSAAEVVPIKPIFDINMADPRFIDEQDILSTLDTRPNLMALSPGEFESLITNLFQTMGLTTKLTQASRDGGVDCVAFDPRPVLGGKVIVQAKRYKNTVGVSAVRDLFGAVHNEGASKGILVTTSGFGKAAYTFANDKPLELITGSNLLYLLHEHAGVDAKIEPPEDWIDPILDIGS
jgi:restriction system protein